jgi:hypothetical protein
MASEASDLVAKKIVEKAFEGRTGHGGQPSVYRQMGREELGAYVKVAYTTGVNHAAHKLARNEARDQCDPEAEAVSEACQNAAHALSTLADDDEAMAALRKIDGGQELVAEIRSTITEWTDAGQAFLESLHKKAVKA